MHKPAMRGIDLGLTSCHACGQTVQAQTSAWHCPRCGSRLHTRKPNSISRTWALLLSALCLYIPANTEPVMKTAYFGAESADTILSGVVYFIEHGDWPLALVIFSASVVIPLLKIMTLAYLLISVQRRSVDNRRRRTRLYKLTEIVGRWSMVDVFVVALLAALVQVGAIAIVIPGTGALSFAAVVVLTMLAAESFDPRLIWDTPGAQLYDGH